MKPNDTPLRALLQERTREGSLWCAEKGNGVRCFACGHRCFIPEGQEGICKVRFNRNGTLQVPWGYVGGLQIDPIEKKPFFHVLPGSSALSFGMLGCDLRCGYCQNWVSSQTLRDPEAVASPIAVNPSDLCSYAIEHNAPVVTSTYNEPLITSEWAVEIFKEAKKRGLLCAYVSNGNATPEVLEYIRPYVDLYKVDLKGFRDKPYRQLGGVLQNVLDSLKLIYEMGFYLEVVTLLVPGMNDEEAEIRELTQYLARLSPTIPWHVSAFHPDYKMQETPPTSAKSLLRACEIAKESGLHYVYAGNLPGQLSGYEHTYCPNCGEAVIKRRGFRVLENLLVDGKCQACANAIPGIWNAPNAFAN
ncbi:MAG: AmmeMemoRadiSam system radical SAM enzyme [Bdellovibrionaceae bacterium]|nr:AmmeMemoRadiSam system radical SAM enzyme [Bdellovibrionales bacterium]MCB9254996.1 AmmeMemoRadiSam system radical SAM enzyme [Pseudobdellovibrionaceae bacterium]